jgi:hypothetical protein
VLLKNPLLLTRIKYLDATPLSFYEFRDRYGDWGRDLAMHVALQNCGIGLKELAEQAGGLDYISVATALRRFRGRLVGNRILQDACEQVRQMLNKCTNE